ncbi:MAG: hypothetical protein LC732_09470 [Acidobacteria bacterium]|nr:hypothetical protein [Acidobacteriota bacterium]
MILHVVGDRSLTQGERLAQPLIRGHAENTLLLLVTQLLGKARSHGSILP